MSIVDYGTNQPVDNFYKLTSKGYTNSTLWIGRNCRNQYIFIGILFFRLISSNSDLINLSETRNVMFLMPLYAHTDSFAWMPGCYFSTNPPTSSLIMFQTSAQEFGKKSFLDPYRWPSLLFQPHHRHPSKQDNYTLLVFLSLLKRIYHLLLTPSNSRPSSVPACMWQVLKKMLDKWKDCFQHWQEMTKYHEKLYTHTYIS